ncbi:MAG: 4-hydroxy-tetrahydrodipicolinate reductase [Bdellovibrionota bacterium]
MAIKVLVNGGSGRMGQEVIKAVSKDDALSLVGFVDVNDNLEEKIKELSPQVVVDFTVPSAVYKNLMVIINSGVCPVIGTTGLKEEEILEAKRICDEKKLGGLIAPNFAIGAVLLMEFAAKASEYLPSVEIIELHHDQKIDAPSGTALKTAEKIAKNRGEYINNIDEKILDGARGAVYKDIHIHSVRLQGLVAHEEVLLGGVGQMLTIRHDSFNRESFMPGVIYACKKVVSLNALFYGLEEIL